jgi:hypothetical protein
MAANSIFERFLCSLSALYKARAAVTAFSGSGAVVERASGRTSIAVHGSGDPEVHLGSQTALRLGTQGQFVFRNPPPLAPQSASTRALAPRMAVHKPDTADFPSGVISWRSITADFPSVSLHPASITADLSTVSLLRRQSTADFASVSREVREDMADFPTVLCGFSESTDEKPSALIAGAS